MNRYDEWLAEELKKRPAAPSTFAAETPAQKHARQLDRYTLAVTTERKILADIEQRLADPNCADRSHWEHILELSHKSLSRLEEKLAAIQAQSSP